MSFSTLPPGASSSIKPFTISTSQESIDELKSLIKAAKIAPKTYESLHADTKAEKYGVGYDWLIKARDEWLQFDWKKSETHFNSFPQYKTPINYGGAEWDVHFMALFSKKQDAIPLLYLHGWPGSFIEFIPTLELLREKYTPETLPYHVIVPSLPGYTYSSAPPLDREPEENDLSMIMDALMHTLGFGGGYVAQGGDIGSRVARRLGTDSDSCKAVHVNVVFMNGQPDGVPETTSLPEYEQEGLRRMQEFRATGWAYALEHSTRPSTIGFVLQSSPIALLSWIGEKFISWSDETPPLHTILESITLYWLTETIARCVWPYRQAIRSTPFARITKPYGFSSFPKELSPAPRSWAETTGDLVFYRRHEKGGHFAALEVPDILLKDVEDFVALVWKA